MTPHQAYTELEKRLKEVTMIFSCSHVLEWEMETYMPSGGAGHRSEQLSYLAGLSHEKFTDPGIGDLLAVVEGSDLVSDPESDVAANIRETRHQYDRRTKLPQELVEEISRVTSLAHGEWVKARENSDFKAFLPWLEKVVALVRRKAEALGHEGEAYNALLDEYEPGTDADETARLFEDLRGDLVDLVGRINDASKKPDVSIVRREYDVSRQAVFGEMVAAAIGFDFKSGRLDVTTHPFCAGFGPGDTRITTRYNPRYLNDALFGTIHEAGHGLYEMGLDKQKHYGMPMGDANSTAIHESQSLTWENLVGRSRAFWVYFFPQAQRIFREALADVKLDDFYAAINYVTPSYIRIEADEATYNLHILLRFELERALMSGDLKPADIPGEWNSHFKKYLGIEVDKDANGCLQDIHWSAGYIGYFPTYALGNLYSAQFFAQAKADIPNLGQQFETGNFTSLLAWLREKIHRHGSKYRPGQLCERITGQPLSHKPFIDYLNGKFGQIYGC